MICFCRIPKDDRGHSWYCPANHRIDNPINQKIWTMYDLDRFRADVREYAPFIVFLYSKKTPGVHLADFMIDNMNRSECVDRSLAVLQSLNWGQFPRCTKKSYNSDVTAMRGKKRKKDRANYVPSINTTTTRTSSQLQSQNLKFYEIASKPIDISLTISLISTIEAKIKKQLLSNKHFSYLFFNGHWEKMSVLAKTFDARLGNNVIWDLIPLLRATTHAISLIVLSYLDLVRIYRLKFAMQSANVIGELRREDYYREIAEEAGEETKKADEPMTTQTINDRGPEQPEAKIPEREMAMVNEHLSATEIKTVVTTLESLNRSIYSTKQVCSTMLASIPHGTLIEPGDMICFQGMFESLAVQCSNAAAIRHLLKQLRLWTFEYQPKS